MEITIAKTKHGFDITRNGEFRSRVLEANTAAELAGDAFGNAGYGLGGAVFRAVVGWLSVGASLVDLERVTDDDGFAAVDLNVIHHGIAKNNLVRLGD